jgi:hypothetical protein
LPTPLPIGGWLLSLSADAVIGLCAAPALVLGDKTYPLYGCAGGFAGGANRPFLRMAEDHAFVA